MGGQNALSIGEVAERASVTVRTLQYYDRIGLLKSTFNRSGRRTYTQDDVVKLQQILFLKSFGFPLKEIAGHILDHQTPSDLVGIFSKQREILQSQIGNLNKVINVLDAIIAQLGLGQEVSIDRLITIMDLMKRGNPFAFVMRYFDNEQLKGMAERFESSEAYEAFMNRVNGVFAQMEEFYRKGVEPAGPEGQEVAARWWDMVSEFTAGDRSLLQSLLSAGADIDNWPEGWSVYRDAMTHFLGKALTVYFQRHGIRLSEAEAGERG